MWRARVDRRHGRDRGGLLRLRGTHWLGKGLSTLWRARVERRHGRDRGGLLRLRGTHLLGRGLSTLLRARVDRRHGRDMGGLLRLRGTQWLWLCKGLRRDRYEIHTPGWWLGRCMWLWLWLWLWTTKVALGDPFWTHGLEVRDKWKRAVEEQRKRAVGERLSGLQR